MIVLDRIPAISVSSTSDDVIVASSDVAELLVNGDSLFYTDVNISSRDAVASELISAQVCFTATDDFG